MAGVTDRPFRMLADVRRGTRGVGDDHVRRAAVDDDENTVRMDHAGEPEPRVVQLAGDDPVALAEAARRNVDLGAQIIDINMGCPAKKVCNGCAARRCSPTNRWSRKSSRRWSPRSTFPSL